MLKYLILVFGIFLYGCGEAKGKTYVSTPTEVHTNETTTVNGDAVIVNSNGESNVTVVKNENGNIEINCGDGGCGDISIGTIEDEDENENNETKEENE